MRLMKQDYKWLEPWTDAIAGSKVLELGCGQGIDSHFIARHAQKLIACDIHPPKPLQKAECLAVDHSKTLPFIDGYFDLIIASLCLHYFEHDKTLSILEEIKRVLPKGGGLICRLNSSRDVNFGAKASLEKQTHFVCVNGQLKCFFDKSSIKTMFSEHWHIVSLREVHIDRYDKNKVVWELFAKPICI